MSDDLSDLPDWDWLEGLRELASEVVEAKAKDGQEPDYESLRKMAREADARAKSEQSRALTSHDRKAIDKEFWDSI